MLKNECPKNLRTLKSIHYYMFVQHNNFITMELR